MSAPPSSPFTSQQSFAPAEPDAADSTASEPAPPDPLTAEPELVVFVRLERDFKGLFGTLRRLLKQEPDTVRLAVTDDGSGDAALHQTLERVLGEAASGRVVLRSHEETRGFAACVNEVAAECGGHLLVIEPGVRVFPGLSAGFLEAARADPETGIWCALSDRSRRAQLAEWENGFAVPA